MSDATVDALLRGETLKVVLTPDPAIPHNRPEIQESFELPHVVIDRDGFWAKTTTVISLDFHSGGVEAYDLSLPGSYAYSNYADLVVNSSFLSGLVRCYDAQSYSQLDFITQPDHDLVWEHGETGDMAALREAVSTGRSLKIALLDDQNYWNIHPVNMPTVRTGEDWFQLFTDKDAYPTMFRMTESARNFSDVLGRQLDERSGGDRTKLGDSRAMVVMNQEFFSCFYRVFADGNYVRGLGRDDVVIGDDGKADVPKLRYQALKVFAEK